MRKLFLWQRVGPVLSGLLFSTSVEAALPVYRNGCLPDDEPCGAEGALPIYIALAVGFWLWCIVGQIRDGNHRKRFIWC